jgi:hypothetical protein
MAAPDDQISAAELLEAQTRKTRLTLFAILFLCSSIPLFFPFLIKLVPNKPVDSSYDLYKTLMDTKDGTTVLVQTDWTNGTRGESGGQFEAIMRILMRKHCKLAIYSNGDPNAPRVAMDDLETLNADLPVGQRYKHWDDYVSIGFFPNAEGNNAAMAASLRKAWSDNKDVDPAGKSRSVFESPVLASVQTVKDCSLLVLITPSDTFNVMVERLSGKIPIGAAVTGVMGPESEIYYKTKQVGGLAAGVKGAYDLESLMETGINWTGPDGKVAFQIPSYPTVPGWPGQTNYGRGRQYFPPLVIDLTLLIVAVIVGNIQMLRAKRKAA